MPPVLHISFFHASSFTHRFFALFATFFCSFVAFFCRNKKFWVDAAVGSTFAVDQEWRVPRHMFTP